MASRTQTMLLAMGLGALTAVPAIATGTDDLVEPPEPRVALHAAHPKAMIAPERADKPDSAPPGKSNGETK